MQVNYIKLFLSTVAVITGSLGLFMLRFTLEAPYLAVPALFLLLAAWQLWTQEV